MELKEYLALFRRHINLFLGIVLVFLLLGAMVRLFQPVRFRAELVLNVTRLGQEETTDYRYDDFYRLQADERFADTVVRWLETARMKENIQSTAGSTAYPSSIDAKRLSSQMIAVELVANDTQTLEKIARAIPQAINQESGRLNQWQKEKNWFIVVANEPVVDQIVWEWHWVIFISLLLGIFAAFWSVIIAHYFKEEQK